MHIKLAKLQANQGEDMKTLVLTLAMLVFYYNVSLGRRLNGYENILSKTRNSLALERNVEHKEPNSYRPISTSEQDFARRNVHELRRNDEKNNEIERYQESMLQPSDDWRRVRRIKNPKRRPNSELKDLAKLQIAERKRSFPQSFESLFAGKVLQNEVQKKENEKMMSDNDLLKVAEDLTDFDILNIEKRRNKYKMNNEERPPKPG